MYSRRPAAAATSSVSGKVPEGPVDMSWKRWAIPEPPAGLALRAAAGRGRRRPDPEFPESVCKAPHHAPHDGTSLSDTVGRFGQVAGRGDVLRGRRRSWLVRSRAGGQPDRHRHHGSHQRPAHHLPGPVPAGGVVAVGRESALRSTSTLPSVTVTLNWLSPWPSAGAVERPVAAGPEPALGRAPLPGAVAGGLSGGAAAIRGAARAGDEYVLLVCACRRWGTTSCSVKLPWHHRVANDSAVVDAAGRREDDAVCLQPLPPRPTIEICHAALKSQRDLDNHMCLRHDDCGEARLGAAITFRCITCGEAFARRSDLFAHHRSTGTETPRSGTSRVRSASGDVGGPSRARAGAQAAQRASTQQG